MDNQQAQLILDSYRSGGQDARDPNFADSLEQARQDPELGKWFEARRAFDTAVTLRLAEVRPPADLKSMILAGVRIEERKSRRWDRVRYWALAAAVVLAATIAALVVRHGTGDIEEFRDDMAGFIAGDFRLDYQEASIDRLKDWISEHNAPLAPAVPAALAAGDGVGCKVLSWHGRRVSLMCFKIEGGEIVHFFVVDDTGGETAPATPDFRAASGLATAAWKAGGQLHVLVGHGGEQRLRDLL